MSRSTFRKLSQLGFLLLTFATSASASNFTCVDESNAPVGKVWTADRTTTESFEMSQCIRYSDDCNSPFSDCFCEESVMTVSHQENRLARGELAFRGMNLSQDFTFSRWLGDNFQPIGRMQHNVGGLSVRTFLDFFGPNYITVTVVIARSQVDVTPERFVFKCNPAE